MGTRISYWFRVSLPGGTLPPPLLVRSLCRRRVFGCDLWAHVEVGSCVSSTFWSARSLATLRDCSLCSRMYATYLRLGCVSWVLSLHDTSAEKKKNFDKTVRRLRRSTVVEVHGKFSEAPHSLSGPYLTRKLTSANKSNCISANNPMAEVYIFFLNRNQDKDWGQGTPFFWNKIMAEMGYLYRRTSRLFRVILVGELFFPKFRQFFRAIFQSSIFSWFFFSKYWNVNELDIFGSGEFHEKWQNASVYWYIPPIISELWIFWKKRSPIKMSLRPILVGEFHKFGR